MDPLNKSAHEAVKVTDFDVNPTREGDWINCELSLEQQFPPSRNETYVDPDGFPTNGYDDVVYSGWKLLRASVQNHPTLWEAQEFFNRKRRELRWSVERPIYRTARFWVKPYY